MGGVDHARFKAHVERLCREHTPPLSVSALRDPVTTKRPHAKEA